MLLVSQLILQSAQETWRPFQAKTFRKSSTSGEEARGTFRRHATGSMRLDESDADGKRSRVVIRNAQTRRTYMRDCRGTWKSAPVTSKTAFIPPTQREFERPGNVSADARFEGRPALRITRKEDSTYLVVTVPELDFLVVERREQNGLERTFDIEPGAQPDEFFLPPPDAAVQEFPSVAALNAAAKQSPDDSPSLVCR
jgi:hypothetical protein